ncbi:MAG: shikimate dehydrogenase [Cyanophyceae cyanobacterium]
MTQQILGKTKLLGVIGDPVEHSLSPVMHNAAIAALGLDYVYIPLPVKGEDLSRALAGLEAINVVGFNVTIPHKQALVPLLADVSPEAQLVGATNTIWRTPSGWSGTNTDVEGFIAPLKAVARDWSRISPVILGNGGAARAVVVGCWQLGCSQIHVVGRSEQKLQQFLHSWTDPALQKALTVHQSDLPALLSQTQLLVNTTPVGMFPQTDASPLDEELVSKLQPATIVYDLIYNPNPTRLLKQAQERGAIAINGLEMLVQQGAAALKIWLQQDVPVEVMRQSLRQYLG